MTTRQTIGNRVGPWRFVVFILILLGAAAFAIPVLGSPGLGLMAAFDLATATFLALHLGFLKIDDPEAMATFARDNDGNRTLLLVISGIVVAILLIAVGSETIGHAPSSQARDLLIPTLILAWLFSNSVYALHYAHMNYIRSGRDRVGFRFPGTAQPLYWDFLYFAFTFGMSCATSDVEVTDERVRRIVAAHCAAAFAVNIGVLSFTISLIAARH